MHEAENATDAKVRYKGKVGHVNKKFIEIKRYNKKGLLLSERDWWYPI